MPSVTIVLLIVFHAWHVDVSAQKGNTPVYHLSEPDQIMILDNDLDEISGLSYYKGRLYAIQDEEGIVYALSPETGKILDLKTCWKNGDYEAIEVVGGFTYMLKSNGNVYKTPIDGPSVAKTIKIDLDLDKDLNFEGMAFDPQNQELLIAAKRSEYANNKEVYCLPIEDLANHGEPCYVLNDKALQNEILKSKVSWTEKMAHKISYSFNPSGIAVNPQNGDIFILSSPGSQLLLLTKDWKFKKVLQLDSDLFKQPESICFDSDLNLYIGNEARKGKPQLLKFYPR